MGIKSCVNTPLPALSINDLSTDATQPLINNLIEIVVNGEIYNYLELYQEVRLKLPSYEFISNSDSEIIIPLYLLYGSSFIKKLKGMFSFVLYDMDKHIIFFYIVVYIRIFTKFYFISVLFQFVQ